MNRMNRHLATISNLLNFKIFSVKSGGLTGMEGLAAIGTTWTQCLWPQVRLLFACFWSTVGFVFIYIPANVACQAVLADWGAILVPVPPPASAQLERKRPRPAQPTHTRTVDTHTVASSRSAHFLRRERPESKRASRIASLRSELVQKDARIAELESKVLTLQRELTSRVVNECEVADKQHGGVGARTGGVGGVPIACTNLNDTDSSFDSSVVSTPKLNRCRRTTNFSRTSVSEGGSASPRPLSRKSQLQPKGCDEVTLAMIDNALSLLEDN